MGFASLQHMRNRRSHLRKACQPIAGTPAGFGYPLGALLPPTPRRFYFAPAALMGFTLRSFLLAKGIGRFPAAKHPPTVDPRLKNARRQFVYELRVSVSGLCSFRESLAIKPVFSGSITGCSLGFRSSRVCGQEPCRDFAQAPLTCLRLRKRTYASGTTEYQSAAAWSGLLAAASRHETPNNPRRVLAPVDS
jgi:hypothetical protein